MRYTIREKETERQFCQTVTLDVIQEVIDLEMVRATIESQQVKEQRVRRLPALLTLMLCIGMNLLTRISLQGVLRRLVQGTRLVQDVGLDELASKGAISQARYRLGAKVLQAVFKQVCRPLATPQTPGAFAFGLRLVSLDGTVETVADTPSNAAYFGRHSSHQAEAAFPQVQAVYLSECGTHVIFDAGFWPIHSGEHLGARRLTRSLDDTLLLDRGLYSYALLLAAVQRGSQVLCRLSSTLKPQPIQTLADGSRLAWVFPNDAARRQAGEHQVVRIITYTVDDPARPGHAEIHRLLTTLLDPATYPALELVILYHQRHEIELSLDEIQTHQRLAQQPLRSAKPLGVIQELYGLLLAHFVVRALMQRSAHTYQLDPDRLSFVQALRLIVDAIPEFQIIHPRHHPRLWSRLLRDIALCRLPPRDSPINPRVVKRKMSMFLRKRPEHASPPLPRPFRQAIVLLSPLSIPYWP
jgi:hypothetical protein